MCKSVGSGITQVIVTDGPRKVVPEKRRDFARAISVVESVDRLQKTLGFFLSDDLR